jgi:cytidylate kinase
MMDGIDPIESALTLSEDDLARDDLRNADVAQAASKVAVIAEVRAALLDFQRAFAARAGGAVLDGRDIGTVICPDAPAKLFVTASAEARAKRRYDELIERGQDASLDQVLTEVKERDDRDMNRADAPLRPADDAMHLDTTELSIDEAVAEAIGFIEAKRG